MRVLILGGTRFVGRALVEDALARGWDVTAVHRGRTGALPSAVHAVFADRESEPELRAALGDVRWDLAVDTWSGAPAVTAVSGRVLAGRVGRYGYVSSASVYEWGHHVNEDSPVVAGDPDATEGDYAAIKRGAELAVLDAFGDALLARAGLILGPHEDIGRLPWWLERIAAGGRVLAPGRADRPLQYVDARDLAAWMWSALAAGVSGPVDAIGPSGHATTRTLLEACIAATGSGGRAGLDRRGRAGRRPGSSRGPNCRAGCPRRASSRASSKPTRRGPRRPGCGAARSRTPSPTPGRGSSAKASRRSDRTATPSASELKPLRPTNRRQQRPSATSGLRAEGRTVR